MRLKDPSDASPGAQRKMGSECLKGERECKRRGRKCRNGEPECRPANV